MPPQKWERRAGQASLAQAEVRASLERLEAALAPGGDLDLGLSAADSARLQWGGLLPAGAWAARLQQQTDAACNRALERLGGSAPASAAVDVVVRAPLARGGRGGDAGGDAGGDVLHVLDEAQGASQREWSARRAAYSAAQMRGLELGRGDCGEGVGGGGGGGGGEQTARLEVQVQEEAAHGVVFREQAKLRSLLKEAAGAAASAVEEEASAEGATTASAALSLFGEVVRRMGEDHKRRAAAALAEAEVAAGREQLETFKRAHAPLVEGAVVGATGGEGGAAAEGAAAGAGVQLDSLLSSIDTQGRECWRLEAGVAQLYRQRLAPLRRERASARAPPPALTLGDGGGRIHDVMPVALRRFLPPEATLPRAQREAAAAAAHCCAAYHPVLPCLLGHESGAPAHKV